MAAQCSHMRAPSHLWTVPVYGRAHRMKLPDDCAARPQSFDNREECCSRRTDTQRLSTPPTGPYDDRHTALKEQQRSREAATPMEATVSTTLDSAVVQRHRPWKGPATKTNTRGQPSGCPHLRRPHTTPLTQTRSAATHDEPSPGSPAAHRSLLPTPEIQRRSHRSHEGHPP